jgi:alkanesulfonate monooxygenase SsuD/methylene tetrahydromethanopterin reductase-like flavin-dependent oxidoreductase (luciferase family)
VTGDTRGRTTLLAVEADGAGAHPAAWRLPDAAPGQLFSAEYWVRLAELAEQARLDFLAIADSFVPPGEGQLETVAGRLDAVAIAARVAPVTSTIGLVPAATVTHTEPFHLSKAIATLDFVSSGRAGWQPEVSRSQSEADLFGRKDPAPADVLWREADETAEVVTRLWDSWEDDAVIRDAATGRYVDREKLHYINFTGEFFSVKGPSITPRSPQAHPPIVVRADEPEALPLVGRWAQVVRVSAPDVTSAAAARDRVREVVARAGRNPDEVAVLWDVVTLLGATEAEATATAGQLDDWAGWPASRPDGSAHLIGTSAQLAGLIDAAAEAVDGVVVVPLDLPDGLLRLAREVVPLLVGRGRRIEERFRGTFRDRLGLARPENYYARQGR